MEKVLTGLCAQKEVAAGVAEQGEDDDGEACAYKPPERVSGLVRVHEGEMLWPLNREADDHALVEESTAFF